MKQAPCRFLRTKKMYIPAQAERALVEREYPAESPHCWCNKTMMELGPDDLPVSIEDCANTDRVCHRAG